MIDREELKVLAQTIERATVAQMELARKFEAARADNARLLLAIQDLDEAQSLRVRCLANEIGIERAAREALFELPLRPDAGIAQLFAEARDRFKARNPGLYDADLWGQRPDWLAKAMAKGNGT